MSFKTLESTLPSDSNTQGNVFLNQFILNCSVDATLNLACLSVLDFIAENVSINSANSSSSNSSTNA